VQAAIGSKLSVKFGRKAILGVRRLDKLLNLSNGFNSTFITVKLYV
jgi:hypothetical protein